MPDPENEKYMPMYNIEQQFIEQYLWDAVAASDLIDARWASEVTGTEDTDDGVRLLVRDSNGNYQCEAEWVLAADGARSPIRTMRGLRLEGDNFPGRYVIADVQMDHDYPTVRRALFDSKSNPDKTILIHRQPDNIWRIDYQLPDGQSELVVSRSPDEDATVRHLAAALAALVDDPERRARLGAANRERAIERYSFDGMVDAYAERYDATCGRATSPAG